MPVRAAVPQREFASAWSLCAQATTTPTSAGAAVSARLAALLRLGLCSTAQHSPLSLPLSGSRLPCFVQTAANCLCPCTAAGDMDHFDISVWSFEKLADLKWGVIAL